MPIRVMKAGLWALSILIAFGVCGAIWWMLHRPEPKPKITVVQVEDMIRTSLPPDSSRSKVKEWLKVQNIEYSAIVDKGGREIGLRGTIQDTGRPNEVIDIEFYFDEKGRLIEQLVRPFHYSL